MKGGKILAFSAPPGDLVLCRYLFYKHDPNPFILVLPRSIKHPHLVCGLNMHYVTFPIAKKLVLSLKNIPASYDAVKNEQMLKNAYRTYKENGLNIIKRIDFKFLITIADQMRSFDPAEIEKIRHSVKEQLLQKVNQTVEELKNQPQVS